MAAPFVSVFLYYEVKKNKNTILLCFWQQIILNLLVQQTAVNLHKNAHVIIFSEMQSNNHVKRFHITQQIWSNTWIEQLSFNNQWPPPEPGLVRRRICWDQVCKRWREKKRNIETQVFPCKQTNRTNCLQAEKARWHTNKKKAQKHLCSCLHGIAITELTEMYRVFSFLRFICAKLLTYES